MSVAFTKPAELTDGPRAEGQKVINARHVAWIRRFVGKGPAQCGQVSWMPKGLKRVASRHWLVAKDNMIRVGTEWQGLISVTPGSTDERLKSRWQFWKHLQLCMDRGPDGICASNALLYSSVRSNVTCWFDEPHDLENDLYDLCVSS